MMILQFTNGRVTRLALLASVVLLGPVQAMKKRIDFETLRKSTPIKVRYRSKMNKNAEWCDAVYIGESSDPTWVKIQWKDCASTNTAYKRDVRLPGDTTENFAIIRLMDTDFEKEMGIGIGSPIKVTYCNGYNKTTGNYVNVCGMATYEGKAGRDPNYVTVIFDGSPRVAWYVPKDKVGVADQNLVTADAPEGTVVTDGKDNSNADTDHTGINVKGECAESSRLEEKEEALRRLRMELAEAKSKAERDRQEFESRERQLKDQANGLRLSNKIAEEALRKQNNTEMRQWRSTCEGLTKELDKIRREAQQQQDGYSLVRVGLETKLMQTVIRERQCKSTNRKLREERDTIRQQARQLQVHNRQLQQQLLRMHAASRESSTHRIPESESQTNLEVNDADTAGTKEWKPQDQVSVELHNNDVKVGVAPVTIVGPLLNGNYTVEFERSEIAKKYWGKTRDWRTTQTIEVPAADIIGKESSSLENWNVNDDVGVVLHNDGKDAGVAPATITDMVLRCPTDKGCKLPGDIVVGEFCPKCMTEGLESKVFPFAYAVKFDDSVNTILNLVYGISVEKTVFNIPPHDIVARPKARRR